MKHILSLLLILAVTQDTFYTPELLKKIKDSNQLGSSECHSCNKDSDDPNIYKN